MALGGRRPGAGRPQGSLGKRTREIAERAAALGISPLEVMLSNMQHFHKLAESAEAALAELSADKLVGMDPKMQFQHLMAEVKKAAGLREIAQSCARDAAPYMHPRLASIEHSGEIAVPTVARVPEVSKDTDSWRKKHVPQIPPPTTPTLQ